MATKKDTRIRKTRPARKAYPGGLLPSGVPKFNPANVSYVEDQARKAPGITLAGLLAVKEIADTDGLGDDPARSEHAYRLVCQAIANATRQPCTGLLGTFYPEAAIPTLAQIAQEHLFIPTLETQNSDELDFHDLSVWAIRSALEAAYEAGKAAR